MHASCCGLFDPLMVRACAAGVSNHEGLQEATYRTALEVGLARLRQFNAHVGQARHGTVRDAPAAPDLRLVLVGHTDAVGGRDYNRDLSLKRAEAVVLWLRDQGVSAQRLAIDGKGYDEPVADNATDSGRALNRRVQAIRIP